MGELNSIYDKPYHIHHKVTGHQGFLFHHTKKKKRQIKLSFGIFTIILLVRLARSANPFRAVQNRFHFAKPNTYSSKLLQNITITYPMASTMLAEFVGIIFTDIAVSFYLSYSAKKKERRHNP